MGLFVFLLFFKTRRARWRVQGSDKFSTSKTHTVFLRTESTPQCSKWSITTSLMKVSVSAIHYGMEFESEWKPASDAVQCFELPSSYTPSSRRSREMMQTNEKLNISILFFICESTVGYMSLSKADAICMSGCFCLGIFLHISHSRIPFTFDHICFFYIF